MAGKATIAIFKRHLGTWIGKVFESYGPSASWIKLARLGNFAGTDKLGQRAASALCRYIPVYDRDLFLRTVYNPNGLQIRNVAA